VSERTLRRGAIASMSASGVLVAVFALRAITGWGGQAGADWFTVYVYDAAVLLAAAACVLRALLPGRDRLAWALIALGGICQIAGSIASDVVSGGDGQDVPVPSLPDVFWLAMMPLLGVGSVLVARHRIRRRPPLGRWLDAVLSGFALATLSAAHAIEIAVDAAAQAPTAELLTALAYPVFDVLTIAAVVGAVALAGWRLDRQVGFVLAASAVMAVTDAVFLRSAAADAYVAGELLDVGWLLGLLLFAVAAWTRGSALRPLVPRPELSAPVCFGALAIFILVSESFGSNARATISLAALALVALLLRMATALADNARLLRAFRQDAITDPVTGLGNRRRLLADLEAGQRPALLTVFDLNGFKDYNDTFGHLAGDQLLHQIGAALASAVAGHGTAYRMGGDEFCSVVAPDGPSARAIADRMCQRGEGFVVSAAFGSCLLGEEALTPEEGLRLADQRMYADKRAGGRPAERQSVDVLLAIVEERSPELARHCAQVAELARATAARLGVSALERDHIVSAAALHDVGKLAIPEPILSKRGPLDADEWGFVAQHPIIGHRVLAAAPSLAGAAELVRASHERWNGGGYPDGLAGEAIPLGARVIFVCNAYDAMVSARPHASVRTPAAAAAELRRGAGRQFDPAVVEAFLAAAVECPAAAVTPPDPRASAGTAAA
jgi:diguanylate cyclase (GGDEF)-like protein